MNKVLARIRLLYYNHTQPHSYQLLLSAALSLNNKCSWNKPHARIDTTVLCTDKLHYIQLAFQVLCLPNLYTPSQSIEFLHLLCFIHTRYKYRRTITHFQTLSIKNAQKCWYSIFKGWNPLHLYGTLQL